MESEMPLWRRVFKFSRWFLPLSPSIGTIRVRACMRYDGIEIYVSMDERLKGLRVALGEIHPNSCYYYFSRILPAYVEVVFPCIDRLHLLQVLPNMELQMLQICVCAVTQEMITCIHRASDSYCTMRYEYVSRQSGLYAPERFFALPLFVCG